MIKTISDLKKKLLFLIRIDWRKTRQKCNPFGSYWNLPDIKQSGPGSRDSITKHQNYNLKKRWLYRLHLFTMPQTQKEVVLPILDSFFTALWKMGWLIFNYLKWSCIWRSFYCTSSGFLPKVSFSTPTGKIHD